MKTSLLLAASAVTDEGATALSLELTTKDFATLLALRQAFADERSRQEPGQPMLRRKVYECVGAAVWIDDPDDHEDEEIEDEEGYFGSPPDGPWTHFRENGWRPMAIEDVPGTSIEDVDTYLMVTEEGVWWEGTVDESVSLSTILHWAEIEAMAVASTSP